MIAVQFTFYIDWAGQTETLFLNLNNIARTISRKTKRLILIFHNKTRTT